MRRPRLPRETHTRTRGVEMLVLVAVSAVGIYALGTGLNGLFQPGSGNDLGWLAVAGVAVLILVAQMGRVHDAWPHRVDPEGEPIQPASAQVRALETPSAPSGDRGRGIR